MSQDEKPLPEPPSRPHGATRKRREEGDAEPLLADRLAAAAAEGRLEEFVAREFPDNERARSLAMTMMSMSGLVPGEVPQPREGREVPEGLGGMEARGDMGELLALLHQKRREMAPEATRSSEPDTSTEETSGMEGGMEKKTLDSLLRIASQEDVSLDWLVGRALTLYVRDYDLTGRL